MATLLGYRHGFIHHRGSGVKCLPTADAPGLATPGASSNGLRPWRNNKCLRRPSVSLCHHTDPMPVRIEGLSG